MPRTKGTPNKVTKEVKELLQSVIEGELNHIESTLAQLRKSNPFGYLKTLCALLPYLLPKCTHTTAEINVPSKPPSWFTDSDYPSND